MNPWIQHCKAYAKEHNITYACAISEASKTYVKKTKKTKEQMEKENIVSWTQTVNRLISEYEQRKDDDGQLSLLRMRFSNYGKPLKEFVKTNVPKLFDILTNK